MRYLLVVGVLGLAALGAGCATAPAGEEADDSSSGADAIEGEAPDEAPEPPPPPPVVMEPPQGGGERVGSGGNDQVE